MELLNELIMASFLCSKLGPGPRLVRVGLSIESICNLCGVLNISSLQGDYAFSVVCCSTSFGRAKFVPDLTSVTLCDTLVNIWMDTCVGPPDFAALDQATALKSKSFESNLTKYGIRIQRKAAKSHLSFGHGECLYGRVRPMWTKCRQSSGQHGLKDCSCRSAFMLSMKRYTAQGAAPVCISSASYLALSCPHSKEKPETIWSQG